MPQRLTRITINNLNILESTFYKNKINLMVIIDDKHYNFERATLELKTMNHLETLGYHVLAACGVIY